MVGVGLGQTLLLGFIAGVTIVLGLPIGRLRAAMPRTNDPAVPAGFDPLADLLQKAHAQGIQVHAWIITTALWNSAVVAPPFWRSSTPPAPPSRG